jgi:hypothetical protein
MLYSACAEAATARSDGDINVDGVVAWYAARGYQWIAITDHNLGLAEEQAVRLSKAHKILVLPGNELTGTGHVVGLGVTRDYGTPARLRRANVKDSLQKAVDWIRDQGGVPILAHPNWGNVYGADVIAKIKDCNLFEVHNAAPDCNTFAAGGLPGTDDIWNKALNLGVRLYGVGSDDAHQFLAEKFHARHATAHGGECSTYVQCGQLTAPAILHALEAGKCVASSGAYPVKVGVVGKKYVVEIDDPYPHFHFTTEFIGPEGVLAIAHGRKVSFTMSRSQQWVRARVFCSSGRYLWTQPVWFCA